MSLHFADEVFVNSKVHFNENNSLQFHLLRQKMCLKRNSISAGITVCIIQYECWKNYWVRISLYLMLQKKNNNQMIPNRKFQIENCCQGHYLMILIMKQRMNCWVKSVSHLLAAGLSKKKRCNYCLQYIHIFYKQTF